MKTKYFFPGFVFAIILSLIIWMYYVPLHLPLTKTVYRIDTLIKISPPKTIKVERTKVKIKYVRNALILEKPFVASLDTVIGSDSLSDKRNEHRLSTNTRYHQNSHTSYSTKRNEKSMVANSCRCNF